MKHMSLILLSVLSILNAENINENSINLLKDIEKNNKNIELSQDTYKPIDDNIDVKNNNLELKPEVVLYTIENKNLEANLHFIPYYNETFKSLYEDLTHTKRLEEELTEKANDGMLFYKTHLEKYIKLSAYEFANQYPKEKWDNLFNTDAVGFQTMLKQQYPDLNKFIYSSTYNDNIENLHIFLSRNARFSKIIENQNMPLKEKIDKIFNQKDEKYYEPIKEKEKEVVEENEEVSKFVPILSNPLQNNDKPMVTQPKEPLNESATPLNRPYGVPQEETITF